MASACEDLWTGRLFVLVALVWKFAFPHLPVSWRMSAYGLTAVAGMATSILLIVMRLDIRSA